jgi:hypothetical protein
MEAGFCANQPAFSEIWNLDFSMTAMRRVRD